MVGTVGQGGAGSHRPNPGAAARLLGRALTALAYWRPWVRRRPRLVATALAVVVSALVLVLAVPWFLTSQHGVALVRPWIESTLAERLGPGYAVVIGSATSRRGADGQAVLVLGDLRVTRPDGQPLARVPLAEVTMARDGLLGTPKPVSIEVVGAEMVVAVADGAVSVSAQPGDSPAARRPAVPGPTIAADLIRPPVLAPLVAFLDGVERNGFGGLGLASIGLRRGSLVVEQADGRQWRFRDIALSVTRPAEGGIAVTIASDGADGPWSVTATVSPGGSEVRALDIVARELAPRDLLLAAGLADVELHADSSVDAIVRARVGRDGSLVSAEARITAGAGRIGPADDREKRILIDEAVMDLRWDVQRSMIIADPIQVIAGFNRLLFTLVVLPPDGPGGAWTWRVLRGRMDFAAERPRDIPVLLERVAAAGRYDPATRLFAIDKVEIAGSAATIAASGSITGGASPQVQLGISGGRMPVQVVKRIWPGLVAPPLREWVLARLLNGTVERADIALNLPVETLLRKELPLPDAGLSAQFVLSGASFRPVDGLPVLRDTEARVEVTGRTARVAVPRAVADLGGGRRIALADGSFEMADTFPKDAPANIRFRMDGSAEAFAELLNAELLRGNTGLTLDPATTRGAMAGTVQVSLPMARDLRRAAVVYSADLTLTDFTADRQIRGQKLEGATLRVAANSTQGLTLRGEGRIAGAPVTLELRRPKPDGEADVRFQATLDDAARGRLGLDPGSNALAGSLVLKGQGKMWDRETRLAVEADLKDVAIQDLLPGWSKPRGRPARTAFTLIDRPGGFRIEDLVIEGGGALIRGAIDLDEEGEPLAVQLPTFQLSDGDRASLKVERIDTALRVTLRGEVFDARNLLKSALAGPSAAPAPGKPKARPRDLDLDIKVGVVAGHNGEAARQLDLRMMRRNGEMRAFGLAGRIGEGNVAGDMRVRDGLRTAIVVTTNDAGALFRFIDLYAKMGGGEMWMFVDPPSGDGLAAQEGVLNVRGFTVRDPNLDRVIAAAPAERLEGGGTRPSRPGQSAPVAFARMQVEFVRTPQRLAVRDGVIWGPQVGATIEGTIDYGRNEALLRGTFVPAYSLNNLFARIPIVGLFMGGPNEGLLGVTYEIAGPPAAPTLRINPISAVAPGFLRKLFEFRGRPDAPPADVVTR